MFSITYYLQTPLLTKYSECDIKSRIIDSTSAPNMVLLMCDPSLQGGSHRGLLAETSAVLVLVLVLLVWLWPKGRV